MLKEISRKFGINAGKQNTKVSRPLQAKENKRSLLSRPPNAQYIQGVTGGMSETSGECSLGQTIPI